ncbi:expressed unknown protein [Seminavis robusta]|uniref:Uncharacterized protein n=1 Tax=Seminavis robusta TaxID=568900 RepID=A0A9N8DAA2_9STRA|nr:expressed unknown protein [Seminavis robusta]|eukprot:Sro57_g033470.1 n/a (533) ;mRNA; r:112247-114302
MRLSLHLVFLMSVGAAMAAASEPSSLRRHLSEDEESRGFWGSLWNVFFGDGNFEWRPFDGAFSKFSNAWKEDDNNPDDMGAFVFKVTLNDSIPVVENSFAAESLQMTTISRNGLIGDKWNRYAWSSALDNDETLYIGTFNANLNLWNAIKFYIAIARAPLGMKRKALVDGFLRWFHGGPLMDSNGAQIVKSDGEGGFTLEFNAPKDFVGFRSMVNYNGDIYAGSANGADGPNGISRYDFEFYGEGVGAKVFTNAGGDYHMLDDQGNLDAYDKSIRKMCVSEHTNRLFIGTETHECAKVVIYDAALNTFKKIQQTGEHCKLAVSECLYIGDGKMLIGTWQSLGHALYVIDEMNDDAITQVATPAMRGHFSHGVMELRVFKGQLYVGLLSFPSGFALFRTSNLNVLGVGDDEWEIITDDGFAQEQRDQLGARVSGNEYPWSSAEIDGVYLLGTMTVSQRGISLNSQELIGVQPQLWASRDGSTWTLVPHEDQPGHLFGYRTMQSTADGKTLYIGSASSLFERVDRSEFEADIEP